MTIDNDDGGGSSDNDYSDDDDDHDNEKRDRAWKRRGMDHSQADSKALGRSRWLPEMFNVLRIETSCFGLKCVIIKQWPLVVWILNHIP